MRSSATDLPLAGPSLLALIVAIAAGGPWLALAALVTAMVVVLPVGLAAYALAGGRLRAFERARPAAEP